jgi:hypothetical protein
MPEHIINFVEGEGISIQSQESADGEMWDVEIAAIPDEDDEAEAGGGDPTLDTVVWMPLTTVVGGNPELVWGADDSLIPTLIPLEAP